MLPKATSVAGAIGAYALYRIIKLVYDELTSPNRLLPGPNSTHWFFGNMLEIIKDVRISQAQVLSHILHAYLRKMGASRNATLRYTGEP